MPVRPAALVVAISAALLPAAAVGHADDVPVPSAQVVYVEDRVRQDAPDQTALVARDLDGTGARDLLVMTGSTGRPRQPAVSPDGSTVVYSTFPPFRGTGGLVLLGTDGTGSRRLTDDGGTQIHTDPAWTPDGRVVFTRQSSSTRESRLAVTTSSGVVQDLGVLGSQPDVSPDGRVVFVGDDGRLATVALDGGGTPMTLGLAGDAPAWSPDGTEIAYLGQGRDGGDGTRLHVTTADGRTDRELLAAEQGLPGPLYQLERPDWFPDGQSLLHGAVFEREDGIPVSRLRVVDASGTRAGPYLTPATSAATAVEQADADVRGPGPEDVATAGPRSRFLPLPAVRVLDTREQEAAPGPKGPVGPGRSVDVQVTGVAGVPAGASAVVLNVTAVGASTTTFVSVYPTGRGVPGTSSINPTAGVDVPNLVTVGLGDGGRVSLYNDAGTLDLVADVAGYYVPVVTAPAAAGGFTAVEPVRLYDSRPAEVPSTGPKTQLAAGTSVDVQVTGVGGIPSDADAVVVNVTAVGPSSATYLTAYATPADGAVPATSTVNALAGLDAANAAVVPVGTGGRIRVRNDRGSVDVVVDVTGYYRRGSGGDVVPVLPARLLDTRTGTGSAPLVVGPEQAVDLRVTGARALPRDATAVIGNLTGIAPTTQTVLRTYPADLAAPTVSTLNLAAGEVRANGVYLVPDAQGAVRVRNDRADVHVVADISAYVVPPV